MVFYYLCLLMFLLKTNKKILGDSQTGHDGGLYEDSSEALTGPAWRLLDSMADRKLMIELSELLLFESRVPERRIMRQINTTVVFHLILVYCICEERLRRLKCRSQWAQRKLLTCCSRRVWCSVGRKLVDGGEALPREKLCVDICRNITGTKATQKTKQQYFVIFTIYYISLYSFFYP